MMKAFEMLIVIVGSAAFMSIGYAVLTSASEESPLFRMRARRSDARRHHIWPSHG